MASAAEARIRDKAERLLRELFPDARIVHEFDVGGARLDLAAITPDRLILLEIKSENDTLTRLDNQERRGISIGGPVIVCVAERWAERVKARGYVARTERLVETEEGFLDVWDTPRWPAYWRTRLIDAGRDSYNSRALMGLLLKPELLALAKPFGAKARFDVPRISEIAHENLTGRQIRRGVLAALRGRRFGWTCDAPIAANDSVAIQMDKSA